MYRLSRKVVRRQVRPTLYREVEGVSLMSDSYPWRPRPSPAQYGDDGELPGSNFTCYWHHWSEHQAAGL